VKPGREKTWLQVHLSETLDSGFRSNDTRFVRALTTGLCRLSLKQIRALGTHQTLDGLNKSLEYNAYVHFVPASFRIVRELGSAGYSPAKSLASLDTSHEEIGLKLLTNPAVYSQARSALVDALRDDVELAEVVEQVFHKREDIWTPGVVADWKRGLTILQPVRAYCLGLRCLLPSVDSAWLRGSSKPRESNFQELVEAARAAVAELRRGTSAQVPGFPVSLESLDRERMAAVFAKQFEMLPGETAYRRLLDAVPRRSDA
jgi:3-dehydroquinate dehydratase